MEGRHGPPASAVAIDSARRRDLKVAQNLDVWPRDEVQRCPLFRLFRSLSGRKRGRHGREATPDERPFRNGLEFRDGVPASSHGGRVR